MASNKSRGSGITSPRKTPADGTSIPQIPIQPAEPDQVVPTAQQAQNANNGTFSDHDDADYEEVRKGGKTEDYGKAFEKPLGIRPVYSP